MQLSPDSQRRNLSAFGYIRVSTAEQAAGGLGLDAQRRAIMSACAARGWTLHAIYEDAGVSSTARNRPGLDAALTACQEHVDALLVVAKLDRLSRSILEFATLIDRMKHESWRLVALDLGVDTTTPNGEFIANVMSSFAQLERQMISVRTREALAAARERGVRLGRRSTMHDDVRATIVSLHEAGWTARAIAGHLELAGVTPPRGGQHWHVSTVTRVLAQSGHNLRRGRPQV
jgi:DNA invertase Pin-like site-specific DNA recombinase